DFDRLGGKRMGGSAVAVQVRVWFVGGGVPGFADLQHFTAVAPDVHLGQFGQGEAPVGAAHLHNAVVLQFHVVGRSFGQLRRQGEKFGVGGPAGFDGGI